MVNSRNCVVTEEMKINERNHIKSTQHNQEKKIQDPDSKNQNLD